jgi:hypothetical protein
MNIKGQSKLADYFGPINNKKFWEKLIVYFPFTVTLVSDTEDRKL